MKLQKKSQTRKLLLLIVLMVVLEHDVKKVQKGIRLCTRYIGFVSLLVSLGFILEASFGEC